MVYFKYDAGAYDKGRIGENKLSDVKEWLKEEIEKTGYPLEIQVLSFLRNSNWVAIPQDYYFDEDQQLERQIDIMATPLRKILIYNEEKLSPFKLTWFLTIECKKTTRNWVFFPVPEFVISFTGQYVDFLEANTGRSLMDEIIPYRFGHYSSFREVASTFAIFPTGKDEIFEAKMQLLKYISYKKSEQMREWKESKSYNMYFWFPIIIVDGRIWEVKISGNQIDEVKDSKHLLLTTHHRSPYQRTPFSYTIDVVTREYFPSLIKSIEKDINEIEGSIASNEGYREGLIRYAEKYLRNSELEK